MRRVIVLSMITVMVLALSALPGSAGRNEKGNGHKGGGKTVSTISLVLLDSTDGQANHQERVAFDVTTTATDRPFVGVRCWQGSEWVYDGYVGYFPTYMFEPWLIMDSPYWTVGESATCTARLFYYDKRGREKALDTLDYAVVP